MSMKDLPYKKALVPRVIIGNFQTSQKQITISRVFKNEFYHLYYFRLPCYQNWIRILPYSHRKANILSKISF